MCYKTECVIKQSHFVIFISRSHSVCYKAESLCML